MLSKNILLPALAIAIGTGVVAASAQAVQAATTPNAGDLTQRIAQRFGLQEDEVKAVFDEFRQERHAEMKAHFEEKLSALVAEGKLTEDQKTAIIAKKDELRADHETLHSLSPEERRAFLDKEREEMKAWAESQGIEWETIFAQMHPEGAARKMHRMWHFEETRN